MARQLKLEGVLESTPVALTMLVDGVQVFSGQVGIGMNTNDLIDLVTADIDAPVDSESTVSVSIAVTSGVVELGPIRSDLGDLSDMNAETQAKMKLAHSVGGNSMWHNREARSNILINGQPPEYPATPVGYDPGPEDNPHWGGFHFEVSAGETLTCTVMVEKSGDSLLSD